MEKWKPVKNSYGPYEVSSEGRLRRRGRMLKPRLHPVNGYVQATIYMDRDTITYPLMHRVVIAAFIGPIPRSLQVNHKNGKRSDNRLVNLEVVTSSENNRHMFDVLGRKSQKGSKHPGAKLTESIVLEMRKRFAKGERQVDLAHEFGIDKTTVRDLVHRYRWKHI